MDDLTLLFVGDLMLGELIENINHGVKNKIENGTDPFEYVKNSLLKADLTIGNLECVLSRTSDLPEPFSYTVRANPEYAKLLLDNNIRILNLANNHTKDHGDEAFASTISALSKHGIKHFGYSINYDFQTMPLIIEMKCIKLGFLGYNLANKTNDELDVLNSKIIRIIKKSKKKVDVLILSLHWGLEYVNTPTTPYTFMARDFLIAGADVIYGHHSHQLQGVVTDDCKVIAFSLGNFIFDDRRKKNRFTSMLEIKIDGTEKRIRSQKLHPLFINRNFQPVPIYDEKKYLEKLNKIANLSYYANDKTALTIHNKVSKISKIGHIKNRIRIRFRIILNIHLYYKFLGNLVMYRNLYQRTNK